MGIIGDLKREDQGVYTFPCFTLMGYDNNAEILKKIKQLGFKIGDEDSRYEGVEIRNSSPFQLMRVLAKEYGYKHLKPMNAPAPGGRTCLMWTLLGGKEEGGTEVKQLLGEGLKIGDADPRYDGVEVKGASPFKVMRILCSKYGWTTDGEVVSTEAPGGRTGAMWTLTRKAA